MQKENQKINDSDLVEVFIEEASDLIEEASDLFNNEYIIRLDYHLDSFIKDLNDDLKAAGVSDAVIRKLNE